MRCPCGLDADYDACCGRYHRGDATAPTAERLMRSRYSAFAVGDAAYLARTWHPSTRPGDVGIDAATRWTGLEILGKSGGSALDTEGTVRFRAHYTERGKGGRLSEHSLDENSRFVVMDNAWVYVSAI
ncbi:YchJ family protein [Actinocorallia sp. A-T 12471]|uniref:YchJ family protein n=1 Tax=Actinocorallia sp. A-T 12471 TaxID=3089813 RepID=UPI0029D146BA|nr:YchJ family metal-binding protein [Actinocorallia sp. A-T 12471]MDX6740014.1 YchJ family metal-binding protein [Actinocorallia sp. A-T 12471]